MMNQISPDALSQSVAQVVPWIWDRFVSPWLTKAKDYVVDETAWRLAMGSYLVSLGKRYGYVQLLGRNTTVPLSSMYTPLLMLHRPSADWRYDVTQLLERHGADGRDEPANVSCLSGAEALQQYPWLFVLGVPGAGKTTFLRHTAVQAINREIRKVPIFITLRELSDSDLPPLDFIARQLDIHGMPDAKRFAQKLLKDGGAIVLFDGLDEVNLANGRRARVISALNDFFFKFSGCQFVVTCRVAATDFVFPYFATVELADFNADQIRSFIQNWFQDQEEKGWQCAHALLTTENNERVRDLARVPLLLHLLCLIYDDRGGFPPARQDIYEEAARSLIDRWDASRNIVRDPGYARLTTSRKLDLLGYLAADNFVRNTYFVPERTLVRQIERYLRGLPGLEEADGRTVLRILEAQHGLLVERALGVHSFSHLTLQEYFTARYLVDQAGAGALDGLLKYATDERWWEVFLVVVALLGDAQSFLNRLLETTAALVSTDEDLLARLDLARRRGTNFAALFRPTAVGVYLLAHALDQPLTDTDPAAPADKAALLANLRSHESPEEEELIATERPEPDARQLAIAGISKYGQRLYRAIDSCLVLDEISDLGRKYDFAQKLAEQWGNDDIAAELRELGSPPSVPDENAGQSQEGALLLEWRLSFEKLMQPISRTWDPLKPLPSAAETTALEEALDLSTLSEVQLTTLARYLQSWLLLRQCAHAAHLPDQAALEERLLQPLIE